MGKSIILAGVLGGIGMFVWSSLAHMALPLGEAGIREIPNEQVLLGPMQATLGDKSGLYMFPGMGGAAMQQYELKLASNPSGLLIYHPPGAKPMTSGQLITEFLTELVEALLAVYLLAQTRAKGFAERVGIITIIGIVGAIATNITIAYVTIQIVGFVIIGLIAATVMKRRAVPA
jgi:hypothetical protein